MSRQHQIYFLQRADGLIKIGTSTDFRARLAQLTKQHGMLGIVRVINGDQKLERSLHNKFKRFHAYGEWFRPGREGELIAAIGALPDGDEVAVLKSEAAADWEAGERALIDQLRAKVDALIQVRSQRTGLGREVSLTAISEDYGFPRNLLPHLRKRASTVSFYAANKIAEAYAAELRLALDHYRAEIDRAQDDVSDAELLALGDEIDALWAALRLARSSD